MMKEKGSDKKFRVILLTHGGAELVLGRLLDLEGVEVAGVFVETATTPRRGLREKLRRSVRYDGWAATALKFAGQLFGRRAAVAVADNDALREMCEARGIPLHLVANYHAEESCDLMRAARADLGVIYGTNIIRESVFRIPRLGSINLHQGLAPFYRGGPPVFWELYNGEREVGLTVHFVETKVDTGAIILQEAVPLAYDDARGTDFEAFIEDYTARHLRARSAELVARAVGRVAEGAYEARQQDTTLGKRYRLPVKREKDELRRRLRARRKSSAAQQGRAADAEGR